MITFLALGSNLGDRSQNLLEARTLIEKNIGKIVAVSSEYETHPVGFRSKNLFINQALSVETTLSPEKILEITQEIEKKLGRTKKTLEKYEDRIIDIDILMVDDIIINSPRLVLPHPRMHLRKFVLEPLCEIAPKTVHPVLRKTIDAILKTKK